MFIQTSQQKQASSPTRGIVVLLLWPPSSPAGRICSILPLLVYPVGCCVCSALIVAMMDCPQDFFVISCCISHWLIVACVAVCSLLRNYKRRPSSRVIVVLTHICIVCLPCPWPSIRRWLYGSCHRPLTCRRARVRVSRDVPRVVCVQLDPENSTCVCTYVEFMPPHRNQY